MRSHGARAVGLIRPAANFSRDCASEPSPVAGTGSGSSGGPQGSGDAGAGSGAGTEAEPGSYTGPQGLREQRGAVGPAKLQRRARDEQLAQKLWALSEEKTGVSYAWPA